MNLKNPTSQLTEVLYFLLLRNSITFSQIHFDTKMINLSARISDLRKKGLYIPCMQIHFTNKFKRKISYGSWTLQDKAKGLEIYNKINK